ncbi:MAG: hypothetical protein ACOC1F_08445, partial [Myxococcota bacterium]
SEHNGSRSSVTGWSTAQASLPLARSWAAWVHVIEPLARGTVFGQSGTPGWDALPWDQYGGRWLGEAGLQTALGPGGGSTGASLELTAGQLGSLEQHEVRRAAISRFVVHHELFHLDAEAAGVRQDQSLGAAVVARVRAGTIDTLALSAEVASRTDVDALDARLLSQAGRKRLQAGLLASPGTSLFVGGHVPLGRGFRLGADSDWDVSEHRWLAAGTGIGWEHPCQCASGRLWMSRRVERPGTDAWLSVELR